MLLDHLEDLIDEEATDTERNRTRMTSIPNARQISRRSAAAIKKELDELSTRSNKTGATRETLRSLLGSTSSSASSTASAPKKISNAQIKKLEAAMNRLVEKEAEARPQRPQRPATRVVLSDADRSRIEELQQRISAANSILSQPMSSSQSAGLDELRQQARYDEEEIRDLLEANTLPALPTISVPTLVVPPPPPQQVVVDVPNPVQVDAQLSALRQLEKEEEAKTRQKRAGKSVAAAQRNLEHIRGLIRERENEVASVTPSSEPVLSAQESVQQSIPVPGTETQVPLSAVQSLMAAQSRLIDSLDNQSRRADAPAAALLDLRQDPVNPTRYVPRNVPFETPRGRQALEVRTQENASEIDRQQAELQVARSRMEKLVAAISSKITPDVIKEEQTRFARMAEEAAKGNKLIAQSEAARLKKSKGPPVNDLRAAAKLAFMPPATARRLNEEADLRVNKAPAVVREFAEPAPGIATGISDLELPTSDLQRIARSPDSLPGTIALLNAELIRRGEDERDVRTALGLPQLQGPGTADTAQIPPPSNPPEPSSQDGPATGSVNGTGLQHVTAATFPSSKWTTASSLRWLRSNGLHPIRKSTKINGAYSYALQSPVGYSSFNSVKMSHKNKDFTIVYGTPK